MDHDQRFKVLLREFFPEYLQLFFPEWADRFDLERTEWLDKEAFVDPPQGERRFLDLVARVPVRPAPRHGTAPEEWSIILLHVEIEAEDAVATLRRRMFDYWNVLRLRHDLPVLSIGFYLRVGLNGLGWDAYEESIWGRRQVRFEYPYIGLPALDGEAYLAGENVLGVALAALMRLPAERRLELGLQAWLRLVQSKENTLRRYLLCDCLQAYLPENPEQRQQFKDRACDTGSAEVKTMTVTMFDLIREEGRVEGRQEGREEGQRALLLLMLESRFGQTSESVRRQVSGLSAEQLTEAARKLIHAQSLRDLGLAEE